MYTVEIGTGVDFKCQINAVYRISPTSYTSIYGDEIKMGITKIPINDDPNTDFGNHDVDDNFTGVLAMDSILRHHSSTIGIVHIFCISDEDTIITFQPLHCNHLSSNH